jgi:hypothetical protein
VPIETCVTVISDVFKALTFSEKGITEVLIATLLRSCCEDSRLLESYDVSVSVSCSTLRRIIMAPTRGTGSEKFLLNILTMKFKTRRSIETSLNIQ